MSQITFVAMITLAFLAAAWLASNWLLRRREVRMTSMPEGDTVQDGGFMQDPS